MPSRSRLAFLPLIALLASLAACGGASTNEPGKTQVRPFEERMELKLGPATLLARIAVLEHEQRKGLMHVREMPENEGMLFVYAVPQQMSFWMHNTYLPLDIGFFDRDGVLREVRQMYPHVEDPVASASHDLLYALEMNQGWFSRAGVKPGDRFDGAVLTAALAARGAKQRRTE